MGMYLQSRFVGTKVGTEKGRENHMKMWKMGAGVQYRFTDSIIYSGLFFISL